MNALGVRNKYLIGFGGRLTQDDIQQIQKKLAQIELDFKRHEKELCGSVKIKNKSGEDDFLDVYKVNIQKFDYYFIKKQDKDRTLVGYTSYCKLNDSSVTKDLYNSQSEDAYIGGIFMLAGGQNEYKNLGKKLHQIRIEKSITEGCPGKVLIGSEAKINDVSPTGFHYKCGFVPYIDKILDDKNLPLHDRILYKRDTDDEKQIKKDLADKGYTDLQCILMYLPPENFAKWKQEIAENPILDETKQLIAQQKI